MHRKSVGSLSDLHRNREQWADYKKTLCSQNSNIVRKTRSKFTIDTFYIFLKGQKNLTYQSRIQFFTRISIGTQILMSLDEFAFRSTQVATQNEKQTNPTILLPSYLSFETLILSLRKLQINDLIVYEKLILL